MSKFKDTAYQSKTSNDCRVSNLSKDKLNTLANKAERELLKSLERYLDTHSIKKFRKGDKTLIELGVCSGMLNVVNEELQLIDEHLCVLDTDTLNKFKNDILRDF